MSGIPGLSPVESAGAAGAAEPVNVAQVGGVAVPAATAFVPGSPVIAVTDIDKNGNQVDFTQPVPVSTSTTLVSGAAGFTIPSSGFVNPSYFAATVSDGTGFDVSGAAKVTTWLNSGFSGLIYTCQVTWDSTGASGWTTSPVISGIIPNPGVTTGVMVTGNSTNSGIEWPTTGAMRMRFVVTALLTAPVTMWITKSTSPSKLVAGAFQVIGQVASGTAVSQGGAPVRVGAQARAAGSALAAVTSAQTVDLVADLNGRQIAIPECSGTNISTSTTITVKSGAGRFFGISINTKGTVASTVTVYDNTAGSGTVIAIFDSLNLSGSFSFPGVVFSTGLTVVTTGTIAPNVTVFWL